MTTQMRVVGTLRTELDAMAHLVRELTAPRMRRVMRDDTTLTEHTGPSLLDELRAEIAVGGDRTGMGASVPGSRPPIAPSPLDALAWIEQRAAQLQTMAVRAAGPTVESRLQYVGAVVAGWADPYEVAWMVSELRQLHALIQHALAPPRRIDIVRPCPRCHASHVLTEMAGEVVRAPALTADTQTGARCAACGVRWPRQQMEYLARLLDGDTDQTDTPG